MGAVSAPSSGQRGRSRWEGLLEKFLKRGVTQLEDILLFSSFLGMAGTEQPSCDAAGIPRTGLASDTLQRTPPALGPSSGVYEEGRRARDCLQLCPPHRPDGTSLPVSQGRPACLPQCSLGCRLCGPWPARTAEPSSPLLPGWTLLTSVNGSSES